MQDVLQENKRRVLATLDKLRATIAQDNVEVARWNIDADAFITDIPEVDGYKAYRFTGEYSEVISVDYKVWKGAGE